MSGLLGKSNIGGGVKLPFRVFEGLTRPSNPKEGDIWVETGVRIHHFEFNAPWSSGTVGTTCVYGSLGGGNPSATNKTLLLIESKVRGVQNREKLTPVYCRQVQGSTNNWKTMNAYVYHSGTWVQFSFAQLDLTKGGDLCTATTGGWETVAWKASSSTTTAKEPSYVNPGNRIGVAWGPTTSSTSTVAGAWRTKKAIDFSGYDKITIKCTSIKSNAYIGVYKTAPTYWSGNLLASAKINAGTTVLNLPSDKSSLFVGLFAQANNTSAEVNSITAIYAESTRQQTDETIAALAALQSEHDIEMASLIDEIYQEDLRMINA